MSGDYDVELMSEELGIVENRRVYMTHCEACVFAFHMISIFFVIVGLILICLKVYNVL